MYRLPSVELRGVTVAQQILILFVQVRILAGLPILNLCKNTAYSRLQNECRSF